MTLTDCSGLGCGKFSRCLTNLEHCRRARCHLSERGLDPLLVTGAPVSEGDLNALDAETDFPMPCELRHFYLDKGGGFRFIPHDDPNSDLFGRERMDLSQHRISSVGFAGKIEREAVSEMAKPAPRSDRTLLRQEMERRKRWMPFYGFAGGGDYLCLDLSVSPPSVRFYESLVWVALWRSWDFLLASSFTEFVEKWSRHHFLSPAGAWTSFCTERSGRFDWAPERFPPIHPEGE
jgi:hypothetical protein